MADVAQVLAGEEPEGLVIEKNNGEGEGEPSVGPPDPQSAEAGKEDAFPWMTDWLKKNALMEILVPRAAAVDLQRLRLIAGVIGGLAKSDDKKKIGATPADVARQAFFDLARVRASVDPAVLGEAWGSRVEEVPALKRWNLGPASLPAGWTSASSPVAASRAAWEEHLAHEEARRASIEALKNAERKVKIPGAPQTLADIASLLREPDALEALIGGSEMRLNLLTSQIELEGRPLGDLALVVSRARDNITKRFYYLELDDDGVPSRVREPKDLPKETTADALTLVGQEKSYHPVRDWLASLVWDGQDRLAQFMKEGCGTPGDWDEMEAEAKMIRWWFIQAVGRVMSPGCKADYMLVFVGEQGTVKSTRIASLVPDSQWYTDQAVDTSALNRDSLLGLHKRWICEWAELDGLGKREAEQVKAFLSRQTDSFRKPYARDSEDHPRGFVFAGTENPGAFLRDPTGSRRFWPVKVHSSDGIEWVKANRDQLWAQAVALWKAGEKAYPVGDEVNTIARAASNYNKAIIDDGTDDWLVEMARRYRQEVDAPVQSIPFVNWLQSPSTMLDNRQFTQSQLDRFQEQLPKILKTAGWRKAVRRRDGRQVKGLVPPEEVAADAKTAAKAKNSSVTAPLEEEYRDSM